jgi:hypothetical protein
MLVQQSEAILRIGRCENPELVLKSAGEIFQDFSSSST